MRIHEASRNPKVHFTLPASLGMATHTNTHTHSYYRRHNSSMVLMSAMSTKGATHPTVISIRLLHVDIQHEDLDQVVGEAGIGEEPSHICRQCEPRGLPIPLWHQRLNDEYLCCHVFASSRTAQSLSRPAKKTPYTVIGVSQTNIDIDLEHRTPWYRPELSRASARHLR